MVERPRQLALFALLLACSLLACPPQTFAQAQEGEAPSASDGGGVLSKLRKLTAEAEPEFLPVDKAFQVSVRARDAHTVVAEFVPAKGYYLYRDKLGVTPDGGAGVTVKALTVPRGEIKNDPNFGDTEVFHGPVQAVLALDRTHGGEQRIGVETKFQGCAEAGLCYPPERKRFDVVLAAFDPGATKARAAAAPVPSPTPRAATPSPVPEPAAAAPRAAPPRAAAEPQAARLPLPTRPRGWCRFCASTASGAWSPASSASACCCPSPPACSR